MAVDVVSDPAIIARVAEGGEKISSVSECWFLKKNPYIPSPVTSAMVGLKVARLSSSIWKLKKQF